MQGIKYKLSGVNQTQMNCKPVHHRHRTSKTDVFVFINFENLVRHVQGIKVENQKLHQVPVPTHPRSMNLKTRTRRYGKNIERCAV
jgi:hypothetical protein